MDLRSEKVDNFRPISVLDLQQEPETSAVVRIDVVRPDGGRGHCYQQSVFYFERPPKDLEADSLSGVRMVDSDQAAGAAYLRERKELSAAYFEMARGVLVGQRSRNAEAARRADRLKKAGLD